MEWITNIDGQILLWIQEFVRNGILTPVMTGITHLGDAGRIWILLTLGLLIVPRTRKVGLMCACALLGSLLINNMILKNWVARVRPYEVVEGLKLLIERQHDWSFPSGHTASSFAAAVVMFRNLPKWFGIPALVLAVAISLSRLYVGVHYPTDVLFGLLSGTAIAILTQFLIEHMGHAGK
ncbi:MAG: phosphatase PAP2 family protein [Lachnospiraceae bacterium]|nr:phosphatase PAP2 family protein [Lachnospiraceae bacterium]